MRPVLVSHIYIFYYLPYIFRVETTLLIAYHAIVISHSLLVMDTPPRHLDQSHARQQLVWWFFFLYMFQDKLIILWWQLPLVKPNLWCMAYNYLHLKPNLWCMAYNHLHLEPNLSYGEWPTIWPTNWPTSWPTTWCPAVGFDLINFNYSRLIN